MGLSKELCKVTVGALRPFFDAKNYKEKFSQKRMKKMRFYIIL